MKTAVFYDLENIGLASKNGEFEKAFTALQQKIKSSELVDEIVLQKAYIRRANSTFNQIEPLVKKHGLELVAVEPIVNNGRTKNMVDFKMGVDVIATVTKKRSIATVAVASGDSDFGFLCQQIKELGKNLLVVSRFSTTSGALLKFCDDWVDLNQQTLTPKFICKAIESRILIELPKNDFFTSFEAFLCALENDLLIRRYMTNFGLPLSIFISTLHERGLEFPKFGGLGFANISAFMEVLFHGTSFECRGNTLKYIGKRQPMSQSNLIERLIQPPSGYTREKLFKYYDILKEIHNVEEFLLYLGFMRRAGMMKGNDLCVKRTFRATIRKHLRGLMEKSGLVMDEAAMAEVEKKL